MSGTNLNGDQDQQIAQLLQQVQKQNRLLKRSLLFAGLAAGALLLSATKTNLPTAQFSEITVERINVVTPEGKPEIVIANRYRLPDLASNGKTIKSDRGEKPGMIFYNAMGDENGGFIFDGKLDEKGKPLAGMHFSMDRFGGDQQLALGHYESGGSMTSGLSVFDRGLLSDYEGLYEAYEKLPAGDEKQKAYQKWLDAGGKQVTRMFVGKTRGKSSALILADANGKARIMMMVTPEGKASLNFYDDKGQLVQSLPESSMKSTSEGTNK